MGDNVSRWLGEPSKNAKRVAEVSEPQAPYSEPKISKFSKFLRLAELIYRFIAHFSVLISKFKAGMPVSVLGQPKSAPEFSYFATGYYSGSYSTYILI